MTRLARIVEGGNIGKEGTDEEGVIDVGNEERSEGICSTDADSEHEGLAEWLNWPNSTGIRSSPESTKDTIEILGKAYDRSRCRFLLKGGPANKQLPSEHRLQSGRIVQGESMRFQHRRRVHVGARS